jgi:putative membrane protein
VSGPSQPDPGAPDPELPDPDQPGPEAPIDARFSFANERTFLAWNRTALALVTAGLAVTQLLPPFDVPGGRRMIGIPLIVLGVVIALSSLWQWRANEQAMLEGRPLPASKLPMLVAVVIGVTALVALGLAAFGGESS